MKKLPAVLILACGALWPLACGKNLPPTATQTVVVNFPTLSPTTTFTPTASPSGPTATPTPPGLNILGPVTFTTGQYHYGYLHVHAGSVLTINGAVTLDLNSYFVVDSGATVIGDGMGYPTDNGPGSNGSPVNYNGGGGGHLGAGGPDGFNVLTHGLSNSPGGPANDDAMGPTLMGSGGEVDPVGCPPSGTSGYGGGLFTVRVSAGPATLNGVISMNGIAGTDCSSQPGSGGGGGAGGTVWITAQTIVGSGSLAANGGAGGSNSNTGSAGAGGGGGGIVLLMDHLGDDFSGSVSVNGGAEGALYYHGGPGGTGTFNETTF